jgi:hypothetical protein
MKRVLFTLLAKLLELYELSRALRGLVVPRLALGAGQ